MGVSDLSGPETHRYCHISQMHSDQRISDIHSRCRLNMFYCHGMFKCFIRCRSEGSSRLGLGNHIDHGITVFYGCLFFQDQRAVQVFTALGCQIDACFLRCLINSTEDHLCQLRAGISTDGCASHLTGGTPYYKQLSRLRLSFLQDLPGCGICLFCNDCHIFCHDEYLPVFLVIPIFCLFRQTDCFLSLQQTVFQYQYH